MDVILPVLTPTHVKLILNLHWLKERGPVHPVSPWNPASPNPQIACCRPIARQPASPCTYPGLHICGQEAALSSCCLCATHTLQGRLLVVDYWCQPELQCTYVDHCSLWAQGRWWLASLLSVTFVGSRGLSTGNNLLWRNGIGSLHPVSP